jgi:hypothetical protein
MGLSVVGACAVVPSETAGGISIGDSLHFSAVSPSGKDYRQSW